MSTLYYESSLAHHGIKGQKWGVRRFQSSDGRLTILGRKRNQVKELKRSERDKTDRTKARLAKQKEKLKYEKSLAPDEHPVLDATKDKVKKTTRDTINSTKLQKVAYDKVVAESKNKGKISSEDEEILDFTKKLSEKYLVAASVDSKNVKVTKEYLKKAWGVKVKDVSQDIVTRFDEFRFR